MDNDELVPKGNHPGEPDGLPWVRGYTKRSKKTGEMYRKPARPLERPDLQVNLGRKQTAEHIAKAQANRQKNSE